MSRRVRITICCVLVLFAFGAGILAYAQTYSGKVKDANAVTTPKTFFVDKDGKIEVPDGPNTGNVDTRGTEDNPFFILEIVPYDGMAEVGYLISGQEPIDVDAYVRDAYDGDKVPGQDAFYTATNKTFYYWLADAPDTFPKDIKLKTEQYGVMTRVADKAGKYKRVETKDGETVTAVSYVADSEGNFLWTPLGIEECLALTDAEKAEYDEIMEPADAIGTQIKMFFTEVEYVKHDGKVLDHKDTFLRESVGLAYRYDSNGVRYSLSNAETEARIADYHTVVYTVTPEDLNLNLDLIDRADMIFISWDAEMVPGDMNLDVLPGESLYGGDGKVQHKYRYVPYARKEKIGYEEPEGTYGRKLNVPGATFKTNCLSWEAVVRIYENNTDPSGICPLVADYDMYMIGKDDNAKSVTLRKMAANGKTKEGTSEQGTQNNLAKLYLLSYQMTNPVFEAFYGELSDVNGMFESVPMKDASGNVIKNKDGSNLTTGKFNYDKYWDSSKKVSANHDSKVYWHHETLLPWHVVPNESSLNDSSPCSEAMAPYQVMIKGVGTYNMGTTWDTIRNAFLSFNGDTKLGVNFDTQASGMQDNQYGYEVYDYFDSINGSDPRPGTDDLTMADCLNYLLNPDVGPSISTKEYRILELQASAMYENATTFWKPLIATYTNSITTPVVETMTTPEFIGVALDCMAEYDLIYVGTNKLSTDPTMKFDTENFVYAHTGPKKKIDDKYKAMYGWLGSHERNKEKYFVYSGNDLTTFALKKLMQYGQEGFPILFGSGFYESTNVSNVDKDIIDINSNIYKLGTTAGNRINIDMLNTSWETADKLRELLTTKSKKVEMYFADEGDYPVLYSSDTSKPDSERYINTSTSDRILEYKFTVNAPVGTSYKVKLYVDSNTDGIFKKGQEDLNVTLQRLKEDGTSDVMISNGIVEAGKSYRVTRTIEDRIGSVVWKLALVNVTGTEEKVYDSLTGVSAIKAVDESEIVDIVVLQILPNSAGVTLELPISETDANNKGGSTKMFYEKAKDINGMKIKFVRLKQGEILNRIKYGYTEAGVTYPPNPNYLYDNFDMLVLGFADCYDGVSDGTEGGLIDAIQKFIGLGKAVLYTHDTSSYIGPAGGDFSSWGKTITEKLRYRFGMDRYGAMDYLVPGSVTIVDRPYIAGQQNLIHMNADNSKELRQGFTNGALWRCLYPTVSSDPDPNVTTNKISRVNVGAITEYPYNIPEVISVDDTHPQYYQLDMEKEDIVVWYCLAEGTGGQTYENDFFGATPNDVRNNYYIYNKGNVTYSGMGHKLNNGTMTLTEKEIELFVNTFVAAYRAAAKPLKVEITNDDATQDGAGDYYLCVDVDSSKPTEAYGNDIVDTYTTQKKVGDEYQIDTTVTKTSKRVYFRLVNTSSYGDAMNYSLKISVNGGAVVDGVQINGTSKMLAVFERDTGDLVEKDADLVANGVKEYYVDVPITLEQDGSKKAVGKTTLKIEAFLKYMEGEEPIPTETEATILPRGLFDLD